MNDENVYIGIYNKEHIIRDKINFHEVEGVLFHNQTEKKKIDKNEHYKSYFKWFCVAIFSYLVLMLNYLHFTAYYECG